MSNADDLLKTNRVGAVIRAGEVADAVKDAAVLDNPGKAIKIENMNA